MTIRKIEIQRLTMISSKPFEAVVAALETAVGHPDMCEFMKATAGARTFTDLESSVRLGIGRTGMIQEMITSVNIG